MSVENEMVERVARARSARRDFVEAFQATGTPLLSPVEMAQWNSQALANAACWCLNGETLEWTFYPDGRPTSEDAALNPHPETKPK